MQERHAPGATHRTDIVVPSRSDTLLRTVSEPAGGPLGKRTMPGRINPGFFTVERVLIIMTALSAIVALLGKSHCRTTGWTTPDQQSTVCWSLFPNAFVDDKIASLTPFFSQGSQFEHSVFAGWIAGITAWLTKAAGEGPLRQLAFFDVNAALIAAVWLATVIIVARTARRRPWDAAIVAVSPALLLIAYVSWDFWAAGLVSLAIFFLSRQRILYAGALLGLAGLAAPYPFVILAALLFLGFRTGRATKMVELIAAAIITWLIGLAPVMSINPPAYPDYLQKLFTAEPSASSIYGGWNLIAERMHLPALSVQAGNSLAALLLLAVLGGVVWLALYTPRRPRTAQLIFVAVAGFAVVNKAAEPWHVIWLIPLVALALPRWRPVLLWQAAIITHFIAQMLYESKILGGIGNQHAIDTPYFVMAAFLGGAATIAMVGLVIRDMYAPRFDVVRRGGVDDPQGQVFLTGPSDPKESLGKQAPLTAPTAPVAPAASRENKQAEPGDG